MLLRLAVFVMYTRIRKVLAGTPINTDPDNKKGTTLFRETLFNPVMSNPIEHIQIFFPLNSFCNPPV